MDQIAQIRDATDVVALLSEYITLKKAGRNFKALCPFHGEKTPSFVVSPERQMWHCFGCQKGGDAFSFLMEYEHMEFPEALRFLSKRTGIKIEQDEKNSQITSKKEILYTLNRLAEEFYHFVLMKHPAGEKALTYLTRDRKIDEKVIKTFKLGYAPPSGNALMNFLLQKKKYKKDDVLEAGLGYLRGGRLVDFFTNRVIFPLVDHRDNVVGFSGRILSDEATGPKYVNTRETLVYHKGQAFFGLNIAKSEIRKEDRVIVTEGEFDVISSFQEGIGNTVAVKGSSLTQEQARLLSRFATKITLAFDQDTAGENAVKRSVPFLEQYGRTITVISDKNAKDPDEALKTDPYAYKQAVKHDVDVYDYLLREAIERLDVKTPTGKRAISEELLPLFEGIQNEIVKEHYFRKLADSLDTSYESLQRQVEKGKKEEISTQHIHQHKKKEREEMLEEYLVSLILQSDSPKKAVQETVAILSQTVTKERAYQKVIYRLFEHFQKEEHFDSKTFGNQLPQELLTSYNTSFLYQLPKFETGEQLFKEIKKAAKELRTLYIRTQLKVLAEKIREKTTGGDLENEDIKKLQSRFSELSLLLKE
ncbi:MAG: DNA primase [Candidatus Levybacteria bacterium]|nr:DNA primase [Candidatus Levybacteria bacterium]